MGITHFDTPFIGRCHREKTRGEFLSRFAPTEKFCRLFIGYIHQYGDADDLIGRHNVKLNVSSSSSTWEEVGLVTVYRPKLRGGIHHQTVQQETPDIWDQTETVWETIPWFFRCLVICLLSGILLIFVRVNQEGSYSHSVWLCITRFLAICEMGSDGMISSQYLLAPPVFIIQYSISALSGQEWFNLQIKDGRALHWHKSVGKTRQIFWSSIAVLHRLPHPSSSTEIRKTTTAHIFHVLLLTVYGVCLTSNREIGRGNYRL